MQRAVFCLVLGTTLFVSPLVRAQAVSESRAESAGGLTVDAAMDWPWWRGPTRDGIAAAGQNPPLRWGEKDNLLWSVPVPGRGHGSPTVVGEQVFLATADLEAQTQSVLCYHRQTGEKQWETIVHRGGIEKAGNAKNSLASVTVACDGRHLFVNFLNAGAVFASALSRSGDILWRTKISDFVIHQGFGPSPTIYGPLVIFAADNKGGGTIAALVRATGAVVWKQDRPAKPNYASPILLNTAGREQLLLCGCDMISSFDPTSGKKSWEFGGSTTECVTSMVTDGERVFISGGYPRSHVAAVRADGTGKLEWENNSRVYVPSMIVRDGHLYAVLDAGFATCWKSDTGKEIWKERIAGTFSSSLVLVGEHLLATSEAGKTYVLRAQPNRFELIAENQLGDDCYATPAVCGSRIYLRVGRREGERRVEYLCCVGAKP
jgi:outer membrane protein assembly factor BamB